MYKAEFFPAFIVLIATTRWVIIKQNVGAAIIMDNKEFHTRMMSQYMLREFQAQRKADAANLEFAPRYQQFNDELLQYPIFSNHACSDQNAAELLEHHTDLAYCQRWRFFYDPQPEKLPQNAYQEELIQQKLQLEQKLRSLNSPRLILFAATFLLTIVLVMQGKFLLPFVPITLLVAYWVWSGRHVRQVQAQLDRHYAEIDRLLQQRDTMAHQMASLPPAAHVADFHVLAQRAIGQVLDKTLAQVLPVHERSDLRQALRKRGWEGYLFETWGYLQLALPSQAAHPLRGHLLDVAQAKLCAFQDLQPARSGSLFRLPYLQVAILTQQGLLLGRCFYDRVADRLLGEQYEFFSYTRLQHVQVAEQALPPISGWEEMLPPAVKRRFFQHAVPVLSILPANTAAVELAGLPKGEKQSASQFWRDYYGLDNDLHRFGRALLARLLPEQVAA